MCVTTLLTFSMMLCDTTVFQHTPLIPYYCKAVFLFQFKGRGRWVHWNEAIKNINLGDKNTKVQDIIVPTIDTVRYTYLMDLCIQYGT